jgi:hypothetical protein
VKKAAAMKATEAVTQFLEPWTYPNEFGILEVDFDEIKVGEHLGDGKKASTSEAVWNGKTVALKCWNVCSSDYANSLAYSHWELSRYCDLKEAQGSLVPRLQFVSRNKDNGILMLGLEMGEPVDCCDEGLEDAKGKLHEAIKKLWWKQRRASWRNDNLVWMRNGDGSRRLVAIDLESFIPHFEGGKSTIPHAPSSIANVSYFGVPEVSPSGVSIPECDKSWEWSTSGRIMTGYWGERPVTLLPKRWTRSSLEIEMELYSLLEKVQGVLIPRPLFVARERDGTLLLGCEQMDSDSCLLLSRRATEEMQQKLLQFGWTLPKVLRMRTFLQGLPSSTDSASTGEDISLMILFDLTVLERVVVGPQTVVADLMDEPALGIPNAEVVTPQSSSMTKDEPSIPVNENGKRVLMISTA